MVVQAGKLTRTVFNGGLNTNPGRYIEDNQSPYCKNVHSNIMGTLNKRKGFTKFNSTIVGTGTTGNGIFDFWKDEKTQYVMGYFDASLYKMDNADGTWDSLTFITAMSNATMSFVNFDGSLIMATEGNDRMQKWFYKTKDDTNAMTMEDMPVAAFRPKKIIVWHNMLMGIGMTDNPSRLQYGDNNSLTSFPTGNYYDLKTYDGDINKGMAELKRHLFIFKERSIHQISYLGGSPLLSAKIVVHNIGTNSPETIQNVTHPKLGEVLMFLGNDKKFYAFDGVTCHPISINIEEDNGETEFSLKKILSSGIDRTCSVNYKDRKWYVTMLNKGQGTNNWALVYDYYSDSLWPFDNMLGQAIGIVKVDGDNRVYYIPDDGYAYRFDYGLSDNGTDINALYTTKRFDANSQPMIKKARWAEFQMEEIGNFNITANYRVDWERDWSDNVTLSQYKEGAPLLGSTFILGTSKLGYGYGVSKALDMPSIEHSIQLKLSDDSSNPPFNIHQLDFTVEGRGYGQ